MEVTDIKEELDSRLQELIDSHVSSLRADFRRLIGELPLQVADTEEAPGNGHNDEAMTHLKESVDAIHASGNQRQMASRLLDAAGHQACRVALFLTRGDVCVGFEDRGFEPPLATFDQVRVTPHQEDPLRNAMDSQQTSHLHGSSLESSALCEWLGEGRPAQACLAPIVVGGRTVGVVYADSGVGENSGTIHPEALEILTSVSSMFLERLRRPAVAESTETAPSHAGEVEAAAATVADPPSPVSDDEEAPAAEMAGAHDDRPLPATADEQPSMEGASIPVSNMDDTPDFAATQALPVETAEEAFDPSATVVLNDGAEVAEPESVMADDMAAAAAPAAEAEENAAPADVQEEDARRFARLLVSEIVLYNEAQVKAGQKNADLLSRLKEPIGRSREAYQERFGRESLHYFDQEMVQTLAQGDPSLLGASRA